MPVQKGLIIGPSTGWLYAREIFSLTRQETILKAAGANGVEICLASWDVNGKRTLSLKASKAFDPQIFAYRSLHLPGVDGSELELQLAIAKEVVVCCGAVAAVTHPLKVKGEYSVESYNKMISAGIPLAIENMDRMKDSGFNLVELEELVASTGCKFVLDVQHAYEHDHSMEYAADLFGSLGNHLTHLHVSGETQDSIHSLVHKSANAKEVVEFVGLVLAAKNVPIILEGEYTTSEELRQEIEFLTRELSSR